MILLLIFFSDWVAGSDLWLVYPLRTLCVFAFFCPYKLTASKWLWTFLTLLFSIKTYLNWWTQDNHLFVLTFWILIITVGQWRKDIDFIKTNGRLLIGGAFFFATLWKGLLSPDYISGDYFYFTFSTDKRFQQEALLISGEHPNTLNRNIADLYRVRNGQKESSSLHENKKLRLATLIITWWTVLIEGLLALCFLAPLKTRLSQSKDWVLLFFSITTYFAAPVATFGWTLLSIGVGQIKSSERTKLLLYLLCSFLLFAYADGGLQSWIYKLLQGLF